MPSRLTRAFVAALVLVTGAALLSRPATAQQLDSKRAQAAALESQIASQGDKLSIADEAYNQARIASDNVAADASNALSLAHSAEIRYGELRARLSRRVRLLYMNPG